MREALPVSDFEWMTKGEIACLNIDAVPDDAPTGYILELGKRKDDGERGAMTSEQDQNALSVSTVSIKLPPFRTANPELWFVQVESQFAARRITSDLTRYHHLVSSLPPATACEIRDLLLAPPAEEAYKTPKETLIRRRLPTSVRMVLTSVGETNLCELAEFADRLMAVPPSAVSAVQAEPATPDQLQEIRVEISHLTVMVVALRASASRLSSQAFMKFEACVHRIIYLHVGSHSSVAGKDRLQMKSAHWWRHKVTALVQSPGESLVNHSQAKLKLISKCPVLLSDAQRKAYAVQGINDGHQATSATAQCPAMVTAYMDIVTRLDETLSHSQLRSNRTEAASARPPVAKPHATPSSTQPSSRADRVSAVTQRISSLSEKQQEARYLAITSKHGAPAHRPGQNLSKAVCYNCRQLGHLSAKCTAARTPCNQQPASFKTNAPAMSCLQNSQPLGGSMVQCAVVQADVPTIGKVDAFPDSGSKLTILSQELIGTLSLLPWTKPPIAVVGGSTVVPAGTLCTRISVGPIFAVVEVMVLARNPLPLSLGEDWFETAHVQNLL
ncbi:hypothetical protein HPB47_027355 [Ixodes persulcatus]|uniref:Uncharacterized protein n=1 Tax=Ixodes persulcatus TaxID=34615 RepID=A0AC60PXI7_IXOPE|nr:hypothetical protein HPB47_027355 [Ixodes persulcatus]